MTIITEFAPGSLGTIIALHGQHYAQNWGFGTFFEAKVAHELAAFAGRMASNDLVLLTYDNEGLAASIVLDLNDPVSGERGCHLRWFICAQLCRGTGIGRKLMDRAMSHADEHSNGNVWLTTFVGLEPARDLYESYGFTLTHEQEGEAWETVVKEQEFRR